MILKKLKFTVTDWGGTDIHGITRKRKEKGYSGKQCLKTLDSRLKIFSEPYKKWKFPTTIISIIVLI